LQADADSDAGHRDEIGAGPGPGQCRLPAQETKGEANDDVDSGNGAVPTGRINGIRVHCGMIFPRSRHVTATADSSGS
jgi:hypothetical protein